MNREHLRPLSPAKRIEQLEDANEALRKELREALAVLDDCRQERGILPLFLYFTLGHDESDGNPLDFGTVRASSPEEAAAMVFAHLKEIFEGDDPLDPAEEVYWFYLYPQEDGEGVSGGGRRFIYSHGRLEYSS